MSAWLASWREMKGDRQYTEWSYVGIYANIAVGRRKDMPDEQKPLDQDMRSVSGKLILPPPQPEQVQDAAPLQHSQGAHQLSLVALQKVRVGLKRAEWFTDRLVLF